MADRRSFIKGAATAMAGMFTGFLSQQPAAAKTDTLKRLENGEMISSTSGLKQIGLDWEKEQRQLRKDECWEPSTMEITPEQAEEMRLESLRRVRAIMTRQKFQYNMRVRVNGNPGTLYDKGLTGFVKDVGHHENLVFVYLHKLQRTVAINPDCLDVVPKDEEWDQPVDPTRLFYMVHAGTIPGVANDDFHPLAIRPAKKPPSYDDGDHRRFWLENLPLVENGTCKHHEKLKEEGKIPEDAEFFPRSRQFALHPETIVGTAEDIIEWISLRIHEACHHRAEGIDGIYSEEQIKKEQELLAQILGENPGDWKKDDPGKYIFRMKAGHHVAHAPMLDRTNPIAGRYDKQREKMEEKQDEIDNKARSEGIRKRPGHERIASEEYPDEYTLGYTMHCMIIEACKDYVHRRKVPEPTHIEMTESVAKILLGFLTREFPHGQWSMESLQEMGYLGMKVTVSNQGTYFHPTHGFSLKTVMPLETKVTVLKDQTIQAPRVPIDLDGTLDVSKDT